MRRAIIHCNKHDKDVPCPECESFSKQNSQPEEEA